MSERFSSMAFVLTAPIMEALHKHSFSLGLTRGVLPPEPFLYFVQQDSLYRLDCARALALVGAKMRREENLLFLLELARQTIASGQELCRLYFKQYRVGPAEAKGPACLAAGAHLIERATTGSAAEGLAALLAHFWMRQEAGERMRKRAVTAGPYAKWIESHSGKDVEALADKATVLADRLADDAGEVERDRMFESFVAASRLEFCFWDEASRLASWPA